MILTGNNPIDAGERTPAKEFLLTLPSKHLIDFKCSFNAKNCISTTDINDISIIEIVDDISISAPARGATFFVLLGSALELFQSTLPQGERQARLLSKIILSFISIHAPARGATTLPFFSNIACGISIHAPARGATYPY